MSIITIKNLKIAALVLAGAVLFDLAVYVGISRDLCRRIDTFSADAQASMKLDADVCSNWIYR